MPILPRVEPTQVQVGVPRGPRENAFSQLGDTLGKAAEAVGAWNKLERETGIANELSHATTDYMLKSDQIGRDLQTEGVGHDNYFPEFQKRHQAVVDDINKSFKYPEARTHFAKGMADNYATTMIKARDASRKLFIADETAELDTSTQMNAKLYVDNQADPERQKKILDNYREVLAFKKNRGVIDANKEGDLYRQFQGKVMNLEAANDPTAFINRQERGDYKGNDPSDVQRALDIAIKVGDGRARRDEKEGKAQSDDAKRRFEKLAEEKSVNVNELMDHAKRYGWDKNFTDGIMKMQLGLKVANPYEKLLIEHAMQPANANTAYGLGDILKAEQNLKGLAKQGLASIDSEDYNAAMIRLQGMRDRLDVKHDIKDKTSTFDARREIQNLYGEFTAGRTSPSIEREKNMHFGKIEAMNPQQREKYVADLRREFEKKRTENQVPQIHIENLRNIPLR